MTAVMTTFELDRFEVTADRRLEVAGRWFGVRGLRFVRPSLMLETDGETRSLLAVLDHKPWAAHEGDTWVAAFPWDGGPVQASQAELAVAPSVVVPLAGAATNGDAPEATRKPTLRERLATETRRAGRLEAEVAWLREDRSEQAARKERLQTAHDHLVEERDAAVAKADATREAHAEARRALEAERDEARRERSEFERERDEAVQERDAAVADRKRANAERDAEVRRREAAVQDAERAAADRDEARGQRDAALAQRASAASARGEAQRERETATHERQVAVRERDAALRARDASLAEIVPRARSPLETLGPPVSRGAWQRGSTSWVARGVALAVLLVFVVVALALLKLI